MRTVGCCSGFGVAVGGIQEVFIAPRIAGLTFILFVNGCGAITSVQFGEADGRLSLNLTARHSGDPVAPDKRDQNPRANTARDPTPFVRRNGQDDGGNA